MPDNVDITEGAGKTVAADDVGGVLYQRVKIAAGADGSATDVSDAAPLPIDDAGGSLTVDGTVAVTHDALTELGNAIDTQVQVDIVAPLPAGTNNIGKAIIVDGSGNDLEFAKEGDNWNAADHGIILFARDVDTTPDKYRAVQVDADGHLKVMVADALPAGTNNIGDVDIVSGTITTITNVVHVDDNGGALTVDGTVAVTNAALTALGSAISTEVQVDVVGALPAGTNAIGKLAANSGVDIGDVDVTSIAAGDNNIGNVDIASIAAGETLIGLVGASDVVVTITPTVAAEAHSAGDLLFDSTEIAAAVRVNAGTAIVQSITIVDKGDQKAAMTLVFSNAQTDFGTLGGVPDPDDTEILDVLGTVAVSATDYVDFGANSVATIKNIGLLIKAGAATTSVWLAAIATGTPTPASTSDYQILIGLLRS